MCTDFTSVTISSERVMIGFASRGALEQTDNRSRTWGLGLSVVFSATVSTKPGGGVILTGNKPGGGFIS